MSENKEISKNKLILVEGYDDKNFFDALLEYLEIENVQIWNAKTVTDYKNEIPAIYNLSGFNNLEYFIITRDADTNNWKDSFASIKNILRKLNLPCPKNNAEYKTKDDLSVGVFILPGNNNGTMLEDLCLQTVKDNPIMKCVNQYIDCVKSNTKSKINVESHKEKKEQCFPKNIAKAKVQTYLAGKYEIVNSLGLGAKKGYWNFEHECLNDLKNFLLKLKGDN